MRKVIVTTTINSPTKAIKLFDNMSDWKLVVVGDKKTPTNYTLDKGTYISPQMQEKYDKKLSDLIGWNCIQRRNFGLLWANEMGADIIALVDDDNIPMSSWGKDLLIGKKTESNFYKIKDICFDPVGLTNYPYLWHRGFPLQLISKRNYPKPLKKTIKANIQADFWNGDPDIDAICRMQYAPECKFMNKYFPIASNRISPFNSQNTFITKNVLKNYFLYPGIGRMDDIWASFYVQALDFRVVYAKPSVYQLRNEHDLINDMKAEYLGYEKNFEVIGKILKKPDAIFDHLPKNAIKSFEIYKKHFN